MAKGMRCASRRMELGVAAALGVFALGVATFALAQNEPAGARARQRTGAAAAPQTAAPQQPGQQQPGQQSATPGDHLLAAWLIVDNDAEIDLAEIAQKNAQDKDVKQFAKTMAEQHGELVKKLERFGGPSTRRNSQAAGRAQADRTRGQAPGERNAAPAAGAQAPPVGGQSRTAARPIHPAGQIDVVALKQQLGEKCSQTLHRELGKKSGAEFDRCYMETQVFMHLAQIDEMEVFALHASPELQQVIEDGRKTAEEHLKHAREILKQVADSDSKSSDSKNSRRSND